MSKLLSILFAFFFFREAVHAQTGEAAKPIKVGVLVPLTGEGATGYGVPVQEAVLLAQSEIEKRALSLVFEDSQCQIKTAISAAKKLIEVDKVKAIIGDVCWTDLIAPVTEKAKVIVISTGSAQSTVRGVGRYVFRLKLDVSTDSRELARVLLRTFGVKTVGLLSVQDQWGEGVADNFRDEFLKGGGHIPVEERFQQGHTDFKAILLRIKAPAPEMIMIAAYPAQVGLIGKQARELGMPQRLAAYRGGMGDETVALGGAGVNGLVFLEEFDTDSPRAAARAFIADFREKYQRSPNLFGAMGYDAYRLLTRAAEECKDNTDCMREYLISLKDYDGVTGLINFDSQHDVMKSLTLKTIQDGKYVTLR